MPSLNKVFVIGHLGKDPEVRFTGSGTAKASFSIAATEKWTDGNGQKQEHTEWFNVVAWGKLAETCGQYLNKGRPALVEGKMRTRTYDDKDGNKRYITELVADKVVFLGSNDGARDGSGQRAASTPSPGSGAQGADDDIPF